MSRLANLLPADNVLLDLDVNNKRRLFELIALESELRYDLSPTTTVDSLLARERLGSTGLGQGIAIPHGRIRGLDHSIGYFARPKTPIIFEAPDGQLVRISCFENNLSALISQYVQWISKSHCDA